MKLQFIFYAVWITIYQCFGFTEYENEYDIRNIPFQFLSDAEAVIRKDEVRFEIEDYSYANMKVKYAVTIFNKKGQHYGELKLWYDKFREIEDLDAIIYDSNGKEIRDLEDSDIKDYSDFEGYSLYSDNRVKYIALYYDKFPYTVEFIYEISLDGYLSWPSWYSRNPQYPANPVEYSSFEVITPEDYELRFWCNSDTVKPAITQIKGKKIYFWKEENLDKLPAEIDNEDIEDVAAIVRIAPSQFEIDGYKGNMESWTSFGLWYFNLSKEKDILPETALNHVNERIISTTDIKQRIENLYSYLQTKTRYVSVQLGIGGWQPYDASYVHKNSYGDCKALSNYMVSILKQAGITAYPVLINSGHHRTPLIAGFPSNQFNHVIVCVPLKKDTIWLECTSQVMPPGSIGWSNENREALMITPEGGVIVKTPASSSEKNLQSKNVNVKLSPSGNAEVNTSIKWFGNQHDYVIRVAEKSTPKEKEKWIKNLLEVPDITLSNHTFNFENKKQTEIKLQIDLTLPHYGSLSGKRFFFNPNLMERRSSVPKEISKKLSPIRFKYPYLDVDTVYFSIPENYVVEAFPKETNIQSSFGSFVSKTILNEDNTILFTRSLEIMDYLIPADSYSEYQKFFAEVVNADKQQVVLAKEKQ